mmetsp:Transcript_41869/g.87624  ORF Transcript_41869/g.87624 Transcript_41869/m.87624 type:complete len:221 (+) Transcript_41869:476-1138(+)
MAICEVASVTLFEEASTPEDSGALQPICATLALIAPCAMSERLRDVRSSHSSDGKSNWRISSSPVGVDTSRDDFASGLKWLSNGTARLESVKLRSECGSLEARCGSGSIGLPGAPAVGSGKTLRAAGCRGLVQKRHGRTRGREWRAAGAAAGDGTGCEGHTVALAEKGRSTLRIDSVLWCSSCSAGAVLSRLINGALDVRSCCRNDDALGASLLAAAATA